MKDYNNLAIGYGGHSRVLSQPKDIQDISKASIYLRNKVIPRFTQQLDDLQIMPIDSESLTKSFHDRGINMRYLSNVMVLSKINHVKEICLIEMLARTCKNIINYEISQLVNDKYAER